MENCFAPGGNRFLFAHLGHFPILGLPGNPVSCFVAYHVFIKSILARFNGVERPLIDELCEKMPLRGSLPANDSRHEFQRARIEGGFCLPFSAQDSAGLFTLSKANALLSRAPHTPALKEGDLVSVYRL